MRPNLRRSFAQESQLVSDWYRAVDIVELIGRQQAPYKVWHRPDHTLYKLYFTVIIGGVNYVMQVHLHPPDEGDDCPNWGGVELINIDTTQVFKFRKDNQRMGDDRLMRRLIQYIVHLLGDNWQDPQLADLQWTREFL
jgi:hypothetical protein